MTEATQPLHIKLWFDRGLSAEAVDKSNLRAFTLAEFLESDVQSSRSGVKEWLDRLNQVCRGEVEEDDGTGNAFTVYLDPREVRIQNAIFPEDPRYPTQHYTHDEFRAALLQVLSALEARRAERSKT